MQEQSFSISGTDKLRLNVLGDLLCDRLDELIQKLDIKLKMYHREAIGKCEIHNGNNPKAISIYQDGERLRGFWQCRTRHCEQSFGKTVIGFVRAILTSKKYGWPNDDNKKFPFWQTVKWCSNFVGVKFSDLKLDLDNFDKNAFISNVNSLTKKKAMNPIVFFQKKNSEIVWKFPLCIS